MMLLHCKLAVNEEVARCCVFLVFCFVLLFNLEVILESTPAHQRAIYSLTHNLLVRQNNNNYNNDHFAGLLLY